MKIYNSYTRTKEEFQPLHAGRVKMYVCGPTVYGFLHVGNFRGPVFFNLVRKYLEKKGYRVEYALNFTDVDDKIINRAIQENCSPSDISEKFIAEYKKDFSNLELVPHEYNPKVTEHLDSIENMIKLLIEKKKAYSVDGDVYFQVDQYPSYGKLSGRNTEDVMTGTRVELENNKKAPADFALWKKTKPKEIAWPSPWGEGRPGWHIECSAMIETLFDGQVDIHGGAIDLLFPHHENELAQSEAAGDRQFVKYWMHVNLLNFGGQKMSKSLGNIVSLREFSEKYPLELYKWLILSSHYRSVIDFADESLDRATASLARIYSSLSLAESFISQEVLVTEQDFQKAKTDLMIEVNAKKIEESLEDDFNTPEVWAIVFETVRILNSKLKRGAKVTGYSKALALSFSNWLKELGGLMSLFQKPATQFLIDMDDLLLKKKNINRSDVDAIVEQRKQARNNKDFAKSDELRKKLDEMGISVMDFPGGSFWEVGK